MLFRVVHNTSAIGVEIGGAVTPARNFSKPRRGDIAALSVDSDARKERGISRRSRASELGPRSRLLADTPPATQYCSRNIVAPRRTHGR